MITRAQVDALADAIAAKDMAEASAYNRPPSDMRICERVPSLALLRDMAAAVNARTLKERYAAVEFEYVDYGPVHFFATTGRMD
ncbi:MAG TPA: hypothetical protein DCP91_08560 [Eggerthellaceae bacterium]|nr:hypothetical protein [Eggerthellaceae bacterium]